MALRMQLPGVRDCVRSWKDQRTDAALGRVGAGRVTWRHFK